VRFLVDQNLSPLLADELRRAGHDVVHTRDIDLRTAGDEVILQRALDDDRVLISADTDFGFLLADSGAGRPSVVLLRLRTPRPASRLAALLLANLDGVTPDLDTGAIVVLEDERIRIRRLPLE
jgi:predicted nuclease of predicted toxin-antitoxin system